jgi:hypothetical protein
MSQQHRERKDHGMSLTWLSQSIAIHPSASVGIPKIIHQTFCNVKSMPEVLRKNCQQIRDLNPDFDYRFYSDSDCELLIRDVYGEDILARYLKIHPNFGAARADLFRYLCMYHFGGVYLDIKVLMEKPLSTVLRKNDSYILSQWDHTPESKYRKWGTHQDLCSVPGGEYQQWQIIASPRHPYLAAVITQVLENIDAYNPFAFPHPWDAVVRTTGPVAYTLAIHPIKGLHPHRLMDNISDLGLGYSIFEKSDNPNAHRALYRDYRRSQTPLIIPEFPKSLLFFPLLWFRNLARKTIRSLRQLMGASG